jgi:type III secretion system FlhB-like substrate exporter
LGSAPAKKGEAVRPNPLIAVGLEFLDARDVPGRTAEVLAVGTDELAADMIREARRYGVPVVEDEGMAGRAIGRLDAHFRLRKP